MWKGMRTVLLLAVLSSGAAVTPIEKVVQLLKDLQAKVEKQGANEAAQYDKYACFCKNQAEFKKAAIEKSQEKIEVLKADIKDLESQIKELNSDIVDLGKDIKKLGEDIDKETAKREKEHEEYLVKAKDLNEAIAACGEAIEALKDSKKAMKGADLDLAQLKTAVFNIKVGQTPEAMSEALALVRTASKAAQDQSGAQKPAAFKYQSNEIIATIEELQATFKENKKDLDVEEFEAKDDSDKKVLGFTNEKTFKEKEKKEKEVLVEQKTEEKVSAEEEKDTEEANEKSDDEFLKTLEKSCEQKAKDWDQRSKARAEEMAALAEATETLENGALKQYSVNSKLVGLVETAPKVVEKAAPVADSKKVKSPSFLQIRSVDSSQAAAVQRAIAKLDSAANRLKSPVLVAIATKMQLKEDHFSNVRALIKDLIAKLKADAKSEASTKKFCDVEMGKAVDNRDKANMNIEEQNGIISKKTSLAAEKADEIATLSEEIAQLNKDILDAEELRKSEKAENAAAVAEAKAGTEAVKSALTVLKGFYGVQISYKPPKSDRYGETVADVAPESFSGEYKGLGGDAKGILGILEVIQSDFERTVKETEKEEKAAAEDHKKYVEGAKKDIKSKSEDKEQAEKDKESAEQAIVTAKDDLYDAEKLLDSSEAELEKLSPMCVDGEETYAERQAKREDEIAALKEAYTILDDWQK